MLSTRPLHDQRGGFSRCAEEERPAGSPAHPPPHAMNPAEKSGGGKSSSPPPPEGGEPPGHLLRRLGNARDLQPLTGPDGEPPAPHPPGSRNPPALCLLHWGGPDQLSDHAEQETGLRAGSQPGGPASE